MIFGDESTATIAFVHALAEGDGGYGAGTYAPSSTLQNTLSAVKILHMLNKSPRDATSVSQFVESCFDSRTGGFSETPSAEPSPLSTARALITLHTLGCRCALSAHMKRGMAFIESHAKTAVDHFMSIAAWDECGAEGKAPQSAVSFFWGQRDERGFFGDGPLSNGIAAVSLLRAGVYLRNLAAIAELLARSQTATGGFSNDGRTDDLMTTYVAVRTLSLCNAAFDPAAQVAFVKGLRRPDGGYAAPGQSASDVNITYMFISLLLWADGLTNHLAVLEARRGDAAALRLRLESGWNPNGADPEGWTALLAAAAYGRAEVADLLLFHDIPGVPKADPEIRFAKADGLPIFMAGQKGDVETVKRLLRARPEHIFEVAKVNGHTVLLQAAFYGLSPHRDLAKYLLDNVGDILSIPIEDTGSREAAVKRLTTATYVRGLSALDIAAFWKNEPMRELLAQYPQPTDAEKSAYFEQLKALIAPPTPCDPSEKERSALTERMTKTILNGLDRVAAVADGDDVAFERLWDEVKGAMQKCIDASEFQINRLGGYLQEPPIIWALSGHDANPFTAKLRMEMLKLLLVNGADPDMPEKHPMGVDAVIRSAVLHHFEALKLISTYMTPMAFESALNVRPGVNGQTALYDTVHQTLKADPETLDGYLSQIAWCIEKGANPDIEEFTGKSATALAEEAVADPSTRVNAEAVLGVLRQARQA